MKTLKGHHLPDIHNKGIFGEGEEEVYRLKWKREEEKKIKKKHIWIWENLDTCFLYCTFSFFSFLYKMVFKSYRFVLISY